MTYNVLDPKNQMQLLFSFTEEICVPRNYKMIKKINKRMSALISVMEGN